MKSVFNSKTKTINFKKSELPHRTTLKKLVENASIESIGDYTAYYNRDVNEAEQASKTLIRLKEKSLSCKYSKYKL